MELAELQAAEGLPVSAEEYCREVLHPGLMQVGLMWDVGDVCSPVGGGGVKREGRQGLTCDELGKCGCV